MTRRAASGYALVSFSFLTWGSLGALVRMTSMPESALIVARMVIGALLVGAVFARRPMLDELRDRRTLARLLLMGAFSAATLLFFFIALRLAGVAIGMFLLFTAPVYVSLVASRLLGERPDRALIVAAGVLVAACGSRQHEPPEAVVV